MYVIGRQFTFEAAHTLPLGPEHKCSRLHGHSYTVTVSVARGDGHPLADPGFVVDFGELKPLGAYLASSFDHRNLNDVLDIAPTSENLARHLFDWCAAHLSLPDGVRVATLRVCETAATFAEYSPGPWPDPEPNPSPLPVVDR